MSMISPHADLIIGPAESLKDAVARKNRRHPLIVALVLFGGLLQGCGEDQEDGAPNLPFKMGVGKVFSVDEPYVPAPEPGWKLVAPGPGDQVHAGKTFVSTIRFSLPPDGQLPETVFAYFPTHGGNHETQYRFVPRKKLGENLYLLETKIKAPPQPGRYRLWAETLYTEFVKKNRDVNDVHSSEVHVTKHRSPTWEVEVRE